MSLETQPRRAPSPALGLLLAGLLTGAAGGALLVGLLPGFSQQDQPPDAQLAAGETGNRNAPDQGPIRRDPQDTSQDATTRLPGSPAADDPASGPDPLASEALRALLDRRAAEEARLRDRARLASESPLAPPVIDIADHIRARQEKEAPGPAAPGTVVTGPAGTGEARFATATPAPPPGQREAPAPSGAPPTHILTRGSVIPAVLETALDSDLPGLVRARVADDVYDSLTGTHVLIPRGAQLVGTYGENTHGGQRRLFVTWTDLRRPDGLPVDLQGFSTLGADGAAGVKGKRRTGLLAALGTAVLFDLAGNATQILTGAYTASNDSDLGALIAGATGNATSRVAERYMGNLIDGGPRFRVRAGTIMNVLVEADMTLPAGGRAE